MRRLLLFSLLLLAGCGDPASRRIAFGDSVTWGFGGRPGGWVTLLSQSFDEPIANYGVPTELAKDGRRRFGSPIGPLSLSPLVEQVLLLHGGNDLASIFLNAPCSRKCEPREHAEEI